MPSRRASANVFFRQWIRTVWPDLLAMATVGAVAMTIYYAPIPSTRTFPITFDHSGDIVYPQWAYPYRGWIMPANQAGALSLGGPMLVYLAAQARVRSAWDASNAVLGTAWAALLGSLFQVVLKQLIGGFRPYFLAVCMPDPALAALPGHNTTGLNGVGFQRVMYTTEICTQPDPWVLKNAITSFPSGHATAAFAGFGFLFLWTHAKLKVWADHRPAFWKLALTLLPLLIAVTMACALTVDAAHNWYDIAAGATIGMAMALASYRSSYAAVWDWRYNHIPLLPGQPFSYDAEGEADHVAITISQTAGWGAAKTSWLSEEEPRGSGAVGRRTFGWHDGDDAHSQSTLANGASSQTAANAV
ncbi:hypothetical protein LMH87_007360 [Akanthomyces muscarius]|uniref:Phosphatidic acid phosphatase type 2/haloperoxidase domain-containing protein n=1 Tax=Akanthomyces muscarius TaxID=2231603 RepID=A0A9W8QRG3_AKAMU|nr:hypothetical protein LMH87_007360 [Akanthomyces muscarius]KAJ4165740.1 hypothetical protein LMH87_007360 [Akanthomyces muscarius]